MTDKTAVIPYACLGAGAVCAAATVYAPLPVVVLMILCFATGAFVGGFYFWGLWRAVVRLSTVDQRKRMLFLSFIFRSAVLFCALYFIMQGDWRRALAGLAGVLTVRVVVVRYMKQQVNFLTKGETTK